MYSVQKNPTDRKMEFHLSQYHKNFSKKSVIQLEVIPEYQFLVSLLSDGIINVNDISRHNFPLVYSNTDTKGATIFALNIIRSSTLTGETALLVRMCVAIKRKLLLFYWKHNEFIKFIDDIELTDVPRALLWSEHAICIGFRTDYILYDVISL